MVNIQKTMENHHAINGKNSLFLWPCSIVFSMFTRGYSWWLMVASNPTIPPGHESLSRSNSSPCFPRFKKSWPRMFGKKRGDVKIHRNSVYIYICIYYIYTHMCVLYRNCVNMLYIYIYTHVWMIMYMICKKYEYMYDSCMKTGAEIDQ